MQRWRGEVGSERHAQQQVPFLDAEADQGDGVEAESSSSLDGSGTNGTLRPWSTPRFRVRILGTLASGEDTDIEGEALYDWEEVVADDSLSDPWPSALSGRSFTDLGIPLREANGNTDVPEDAIVEAVMDETGTYLHFWFDDGVSASLGGAGGSTGARVLTADDWVDIFGSGDPVPDFYCPFATRVSGLDVALPAWQIPFSRYSESTAPEIVFDTGDYFSLDANVDDSDVCFTIPSDGLYYVGFEFFIPELNTGIVSGDTVGYPTYFGLLALDDLAGLGEEAFPYALCHGVGVPEWGDDLSLSTDKQSIIVKSSTLVRLEAGQKIYCYLGTDALDFADGEPGRFSSGAGGNMYIFRVGGTSSGGGDGDFTAEDAQDAVGNILEDSSTIDFDYTDEGPSISASAIYQRSITANFNGLQLVNDEASPGNSKYYGTSPSGVKGYQSSFPGSALDGTLDGGSY